MADVAPSGLFEVLGRARFGARVLVGDDGHFAVQAHPGEWVGLCWSLDGTADTASLVVVHERYYAELQVLLREVAVTAEAFGHGSIIRVYDDSMLAAERREELYDTDGDCTIAGRGFWIASSHSIRVAMVWRDDRVACIVAGAPDEPVALQVLRGEVPSLVRQRADDGEDALGEGYALGYVLRAIAAGRIATTPALLAELERLTADPELGAAALATLVHLSPEPARFERLLDRFEETRDVSAPAEVLTLLRAHPQLGEYVLARVDRAPWSSERGRVLHVLSEAGHAGALAKHRALFADASSSPWTRANAAAALLARAPDCELSRFVIEMCADYPSLDTSADGAHAGWGRDFPTILEPVVTHAQTCDACRLAAVVALFRVHRSGDDGYRFLLRLSGELLERLAGTAAPDALWAWIDARRA